MKISSSGAGQSRPAQAAGLPHDQQRGAGALPLRLAPNRGHHAGPRGPVRQRPAAGRPERDRPGLPPSAELRQPAQGRSRGSPAVTWANWFGGRYGDGKRFFAQFAVDPTSYLAMYPEISAAGGPEAGIHPGALLGDHRPPAARRVRLEAGTERHHPGDDLPGRLDLHHPRRCTPRPTR